MRLEIINNKIKDADSVFQDCNIGVYPPSVDEVDIIWWNTKIMPWSAELIRRHDKIRKNDTINSVKNLTASTSKYAVELKRLVITLDQLSMKAMWNGRNGRLGRLKISSIMVDLSEFNHFCLDAVIEAIISIVGTINTKITLVLSPQQYNLAEVNFSVLQKMFKKNVEDITLSRLYLEDTEDRWQ